MADILFVGIKWWGPGPDDFAALSTRHCCRSFAVVDISSRVTRRLIDHPALLKISVQTRLYARPKRNYDLVVVTSPHRMEEGSLALLRHTGKRIVAWLGDRPVDERSFVRTHHLYDAVYAADVSWGQSGPVVQTPHPWPHLVPSGIIDNRHQVGQSGQLIVVGTAYPDRISVVQTLISLGTDVKVVGRGWPLSIPQRSPMNRLDLLAWLQRCGHTVLNLPHSQMRETFNPFFFDLAAAGIPQVCIPAVRNVLPDMPTVIGLDSPDRLSSNLLDSAVAASAPLRDWVRAHHSIDDRIEGMI